jgi:hypothetical protein
MTELHLGLTRQITETPRGENKPKTVKDSWHMSGFPGGTAKQISWDFCAEIMEELLTSIF